MAGKITRQKAAAKKAAAPKAVTLTHLKSDSSMSGEYENARFCFAGASDIKSGRIEQLSTVAGCREGFISNYRQLVEGDNKGLCKRKTSLIVWIHKSNHRYPTDPKGTNGARLPETYDVWMEKCMKTGLLLINHFEKRNKWLSTKLYKVNHKLNNQIIYCFQGSRWWQFAPHSMSLYALLIRLGKQTPLHSLRRNATNTTIIKALTGLAGQTTDVGHAATAEKWKVFLDNRRAIYKGRTLVGNWKFANNSSEGIRRLTDNSADDGTTQKRFNTFWRNRNK